MLRKWFYAYQAPDDGAPAGAGGAAGGPAAGAPAGAAPAAAAPAAQPNLIADSKPVAGAEAPKPGEPAPAAAAPQPANTSADDMRKALVAKGQKAEDVAKLSEAELKKQFDGIKPIEYTDFKLPDGVKLDDKALPGIKSAFADAGLSQDQAQKLIETLGKDLIPAQAVQAQIDKVYQGWRDTQTQWQAAVKADPEIGGQNMDKVLGVIAQGIDALGGEKAKAIRDAFSFTGAGNNPDIIRFMYRALEPYTEGDHTSDGKPAAQGGKSPAEVMYPSQKGLANAE